MTGRRFLLLICLLPLVGCTERHRSVKSPVMYERGRVIDTLHTIPHSSTDWHFSSHDGDLSATPVTTSIPETWGVVFRCEHGNKFCIQGSADKYKALWDKLDPGMDVTISYKEERVLHEHKNDSGEWKTVASRVDDYDFLDAEPILTAESE